MSFQDLLLARRSVRSYRPDPVPGELLQKVLDAARLAPSAHNNQAFRVVVIGTRGREAELLRVYPKEWFVQPPIVLAVCALPAEGWVRNRFDGWNAAETDAAIATDHMLLAAADLGLGTCWIAAFDPEVAREVLGLPGDVVPFAFTPLGWPRDVPVAKERKPADRLFRSERW
jgi:nitroreductase